MPQGPYANMGINQNIFHQSISKAMAQQNMHQNMHSAMRASAFCSAAGTTTDDTPGYRH